MSVIMDLQRNNYIEIPNILFEILSNNLREINIDELKEKYFQEYNEGIDKYFAFLVELEYGFFTKEPLLFPEMSEDFLTPFLLMSSVVSYNDKSNYSLSNTFNQMKFLGVQSLQIRIFTKIDINDLLNSLSCFKESRTKVIEIYLKDFNYDLTEVKKFVNSDFRITLVLHSINREIEIENLINNIYLTRNIINENEDEIYAKELFVSNIPFYIEAKKFNVGLNKKICVDYNGDIKNYINHITSFGNINEIELINVLKNEDFKKKWNIKNDEIKKCQDCQYRYACISNSDLEMKKNETIKINTCNFNPYSNEWDN